MEHRRRFLMQVLFIMALSYFNITQRRPHKETALNLYYAFVGALYYHTLNKIPKATHIENLSRYHNVRDLVNENITVVNTLSESQMLVLCKVFKYEVTPIVKSFIRQKHDISHIHRVFKCHLLDEESVYKTQLIDLNVTEKQLVQVSECLYYFLEFIKITGDMEYFVQSVLLFSKLVVKYAKHFNLSA